MLGFQTVKTKAFVMEYFSNSDVLVAAIKKYVAKSRIPKGESTLLDLLKHEQSEDR